MTPTLRQFELSVLRLRILIQTNCLSYINECVGSDISNHAASRKKSGCFYTRIPVLLPVQSFLLFHCLSVLLNSSLFSSMACCPPTTQR